MYVFQCVSTLNARHPMAWYNVSAAAFFLLLQTVQYILKLFKFPFHPPKFSPSYAEGVKWKKEKKMNWKINSSYFLLCIKIPRTVSAVKQTHIFLSTSEKYWFLYHVNSWYFKIIFLCGKERNLFAVYKEEVRVVWATT